MPFCSLSSVPDHRPLPFLRQNKEEWASLTTSRKKKKTGTTHFGGYLTLKRTRKYSLPGNRSKSSRILALKQCTILPQSLTLSRGGCVTVSWTRSLHDLTNWITWSRGAFFTSSPLIMRIWSPGSSFSTLGPPSVTNL